MGDKRAECGFRHNHATLLDLPFDLLRRIVLEYGLTAKEWRSLACVCQKLRAVVAESCTALRLGYDDDSENYNLREVCMWAPVGAFLLALTCVCT